jgi:hypothetical protein
LLLVACIQSDWVIMRRGTISAVIFPLMSFSFLLLSFSPRNAGSFPLSGDQTVLPAGTELNEESLDRPREVFRSEAIGGFKSYLVNLGDLAFNSPSILGHIARRAGISCGTCHVNGAGNSKLFVPSVRVISTRQVRCSSIFLSGFKWRATRSSI